MYQMLKPEHRICYPSWLLVPSNEHHQLLIRLTYVQSREFSYFEIYAYRTIEIFTVYRFHCCEYPKLHFQSLWFVRLFCQLNCIQTNVMNSTTTRAYGKMLVQFVISLNDQVPKFHQFSHGSMDCFVMLLKWFSLFSMRRPNVLSNYRFSKCSTY